MHDYKYLYQIPKFELLAFGYNCKFWLSNSTIVTEWSIIRLHFKTVISSLIVIEIYHIYTQSMITADR